MPEIEATIYTPSDRTRYDTRFDRLEQLAKAMDSRFTIPGLNISIGWDSILGLIPGIGDILTTGISAYIIHEGKMLGVPRHVVWLMIFNVFLDWLLGSIPLLGDIIDVGWKANLRNLELIRKHAKFI